MLGRIQAGFFKILKEKQFFYLKLETGRQGFALEGTKQFLTNTVSHPSFRRGTTTRRMNLLQSGADPVKGHGCTHVHPIFFAKTSKLGGLSNHQIAK
jgi:hypothetical protein